MIRCWFYRLYVWFGLIYRHGNRLYDEIEVLKRWMVGIEERTWGPMFVLQIMNGFVMKGKMVQNSEVEFWSVRSSEQGVRSSKLLSASVRSSEWRSACANKVLFNTECRRLRERCWSLKRPMFCEVSTRANPYPLERTWSKCFELFSHLEFDFLLLSKDV